ncbi:hypothetical protein WCE34_07480 [Luteimonas sp. MJ204]|uniref:hypothetical protein n=1 Tax=Luteimonas sp. MJ145 TaxID=3129234 RepID=UPI0031BBB656
MALPALAEVAPSSPVTRDAEAAWAQFLAEASPVAVDHAYEVVTAVGYTGAGVDAAACADHTAELREALDVVPVGIVLHRVSLLCAEATGDATAADAATDTLEALVGLALSQAGEPGLSTPIRIVRAEDAYAFLLTLGLEPLYGFFRELAPTRYFPLEIAAKDGEGVERRFEFDFIDVGYRIESNSGHAVLPQARNDLAQAWIASLDTAGHLPAKDHRAITAARQLDSPAQKVDAMRDAATAGGVQSARAWIMLCLRENDATCEGLVDALLPAAEAGWSLSMAHLAVAHAGGLSVERDQVMADALLAAAGRSARPGDAQAEYLAMRSASPTADTGALAAALRPLAADGHAGAMVALMDVEPAGEHWPEGMLARLEEAPFSGLGPVARRVGEHYRRLGDEVAADAWRDRAAAAGDAASQAGRALAIMQPGLPPERQPEEVRTLMHEAAHGGDVVGARWMAWLAAREGKARDAELWLLPAIAAGSLDAIVDLAELVFADDGAGLRLKPDDLADGMRELAADGFAPARTLLARLAIEQRHEAFRPEEGETLLREDAVAGDTVAMQMLGSAYLRGRLEPRNVAAGREWLDRAVAAGAEGAQGTYGAALYYAGASAAERAEGLDRLRKGDTEGEEMASNNLAWVLCTSRHADVIDPQAGAEIAEALAARLEAPDAGILDTFAACRAAVGDHAQAVALQERAIAALPLRADGEPDDRSGFGSRLTLYRSGQVYVELEDK